MTRSEVINALVLELPTTFTEADIDSALHASRMGMDVGNYAAALRTSPRRVADEIVGARLAEPTSDFADGARSWTRRPASSGGEPVAIEASVEDFADAPAASGLTAAELEAVAAAGRKF